jgi:hypothetical protein
MTLKRLTMQGIPERNDNVAQWLKRFRDNYAKDGYASTGTDYYRYSALDDLLDDYRLHANVGQPLHVDVIEGSFDDEGQV